MIKVIGAVSTACGVWLKCTQSIFRGKIALSIWHFRSSFKATCYRLAKCVMRCKNLNLMQPVCGLLLNIWRFISCLQSPM